MVKTREPKVKKVADKSEDTKKKRTRSTVDAKVVSNVLVNYGHAVGLIDSARYSVNQLATIGTDELIQSKSIFALKKIHLAMKEIQSVSEYIVDNAGKSIWVRCMLEHLDNWSKELDDMWEKVQSHIEDDE